MKRCNTCGEEFKDRFSFCPVHGTALGIMPAQLAAGDLTPPEFRLTLICDELLARRLAHQVCFVADQIRRAWPSFRNEPIACSFRFVRERKRTLRQNLPRPHLLSAPPTSLFIIAPIPLAGLPSTRHF